MDGFGKTTGNGDAKIILDDYAYRPGAAGAEKKWCDQFYYLAATDKVTNDGSTIYKIDTSVAVPIKCDATASNDIIAHASYTATTYSSQAGNFVQDATSTWATAVLTQPTLNVASAKVVNVNLDEKGADDSEWPGITDLGTLNQAGSLAAYGGGATLYVSAIVNADNPLVIDYIYVNYLQSAT